MQRETSTSAGRSNPRFPTLVDDHERLNPLHLQMVQSGARSVQLRQRLRRCTRIAPFRHPLLKLQGRSIAGRPYFLMEDGSSLSPSGRGGAVDYDPRSDEFVGSIRDANSAPIHGAKLVSCWVRGDVPACSPSAWHLACRSGLAASCRPQLPGNRRPMREGWRNRPARHRH